MKPGELGEFIPQHGQTALYSWISGEWLGSTATFIRKASETACVEAIVIGEDSNLRLERVAAFIGYLEDERQA